MPDNEQTTTTTLVTVEQLAKFSGKYADNDVTTQSLQEIYIGSAQEIIITIWATIRLRTLRQFLQS